VENFSPGYMQRAVESWPKQGAESPWRVYQNYIRDVISLKWSSVDNDSLEFSNPPKTGSTPLHGEIEQMTK
jgi:monooxygenase